MRIATWNVNSVKQRVPRLLPWLDERQPDVVCLQETKLADDAFAELLGDELADRGYEVAAARRGGVERRGDPLARRARRRRRGPRRARPASRTPRRARCRRPAAAIRVVSVYVPNGREPGLRALPLQARLAGRAARRWSPPGPEATIVCGDMNIAPTDEDVFDPEAYVGQTHVTPPERAALAELRGARPARRRARPLAGRARVHLLGLPRRDVPPGPRHADRPRARRRRRSPSGSRRPGSTGRRARATGPSDHAPVIVDLDEAPDGDIGPVVPPPSAPARRAARSSCRRRLRAQAQPASVAQSGTLGGRRPLLGLSSTTQLRPRACVSRRLNVEERHRPGELFDVVPPRTRARQRPRTHILPSKPFPTPHTQRCAGAQLNREQPH